MYSAEVFSTSSHIENKIEKKIFLEPCSWQVYVKDRMWQVNYSSMLNYGRKILIPNIVIPPLQ